MLGMPQNQELELGFLPDIQEERPAGQDEVRASRPAITNHKLNKVYQAIQSAMPFVVANASLGIGSLLKQAVTASISESAGAISAIRSLATSIVPNQTGTAGIMYSAIFRQKDAAHFSSIQHHIGAIYQVNLMFSLGFVLISYSLMALSPQILQSPSLNLDLAPSDINCLQNWFKWDYATGVLDAIYGADLLLFFQNRNVASAALTLFCGEVLDTALCFLLTQCIPELGLNTIAISDFIASVLAVSMAKFIQLGYMPSALQPTFPSLAGFRLFDINSDSLQKWPLIAKECFKIGAFPWLAAAVGNVASAYGGIGFSSVGLQGALSVIESVVGDLVSIVLSILSPYIAESASPKNAVRKQLAATITPVIAASILALSLSRSLSEALGGASTENVSDNALLSNIGLSMANLLLTILTQTLYASFIERYDTNWPSAIILISAILNMGLCQAFEIALPGSDKVGNFANLASSMFCLLAISLYYYCTKISLTQHNRQTSQASNRSLAFYGALTEQKDSQAATVPLLEP
ncbi:MAG: hypothetical protein K0Q57_163 [Gammaproteobacteria bacterium]|jgi:hypothetical protein|nr:hypothetical protein [Gammaproteobacteria bacterium]